MKSLLSTMILTLIASSAHAEVKRKGSFVPSLCSVESDRNVVRPDVVAVKSACLGYLAGLNKQALEVRTNDGEVRIYQIDVRRVSGSGGMGITRSEFSGSTISSRVRDEVTGTSVHSSGITTTDSLSFTTTSNLKFSSRMEIVFVTENL